MGLFDTESDKASIGFKNLKSSEEGTTGHQIKEAIEKLYPDYEPYADSDFQESFAIDEDSAFSEMYLALNLLKGHKKLRKREELTKEDRDAGPDICITKGGRKIWIEVITPERGDEEPGKPNPDRVAELKSGENVSDEDARRQIEVRIRGALRKKEQKFAEYREKGIIGEKDSCIVAICGANYSLEAAGESLPHAVSAVYPFGEEQWSLDPKGEKITTTHKFSGEIELKKLNGKAKENPKRAAFLGDEHKNIAGIIWTTRSLGNFMGQPHDLTYVHNHGAERPIPRKWFDWAEEYAPNADGTELKRRLNRERRKARQRARKAWKAAAKGAEARRERRPRFSRLFAGGESGNA